MIFIGDLNIAFIDEIDLWADYIQSQNWLLWLKMLVWEWCYYFCNQSIICFEIKFWVDEKYVKSILKFEHKILPNNLDFDILWEHVIVLIFSQKCIRT